VSYLPHGTVQGRGLAELCVYFPLQGVLPGRRPLEVSFLESISLIFFHFLFTNCTFAPGIVFLSMLRGITSNERTPRLNEGILKLSRLRPRLHPVAAIFVALTASLLTPLSGS
jgi:hypothetical protein